MNIYALRLAGGKYYIGKSLDVMKRYQQHVNGIGSAWTKKYKPVSIDKIVENASPFDEDKITLEYMSKYGIDRVRGGSFIDINLSEFHIEAITMQIRAATDCCTQCGRKGHFAKNCYAKTDVSGKIIEYESEEELEYECEYCTRTFTTAFGCGVHEKSCKGKKLARKQPRGTCYRCGRDGHMSPECYASTHINGYVLD